MTDEFDTRLMRLIRLMTNEELRRFKEEFSLDPTASNSELHHAIGLLPRYEAVRAFIRAASPTLTLLRRVFEILESFGVRTRTTGCVFILADPAKPGERVELSFSQQTIDAVCNWLPEGEWSRMSIYTSDLRETWDSFFPVWQQLLRRARPRVSRGDLDLVRSFIESRNVRHRDRYHIDSDARSVLKHLTERVRHLVERLEGIPKPIINSDLSFIYRNAQELLEASNEALEDQQGYQGSWQSRMDEPSSELLVDRYTEYDFATNFDKFMEDVYLLADLIQGENVADMLQIDLWSARPQLYEIWILLSILDWLRSRGYLVELLRRDAVGDSGTFRWNLSYANDDEPCAAVFDRETGQTNYIFYQLHRPSGDMPDISLLEGADASSCPIWSVDPKHSEKSGYSRSEYKRTAERYRDSFGARLSLVVEYFERRELGQDNPLVFGNNAKLIRNCQPGEEGLTLLLSELACFHPPKSLTLVCVDFSSSFVSERPRVLAQLRQRLGSEDPRLFVDWVVGFSGNAITLGNLHEWLANPSLEFTPIGLIDGTASGPLIGRIQELMLTVPLSKIMLVTDGRFDIPLERVIEQIRNELSVDVEVFD